jgi:hypothetical protein
VSDFGKKWSWRTRTSSYHPGIALEGLDKPKRGVIRDSKEASSEYKILTPTH